MGPKIRHRKLTLCPSTADLTVDELTEECPECHQFVLFCCSCNRNYPSGSSERQPPIPCHHFRIVFTDGACLDNGGPNARAGVGMAVGSIEALQLSAPITDAMDPFPVRSNQRAELLAAKEGLRFLAVLAEMIENKSHQRPKGEHRTWIIATDSDYVVRGMTEWLPAWKVRISLYPSKNFCKLR